MSLLKVHGLCELGESLSSYLLCVLRTGRTETGCWVHEHETSSLCLARMRAVFAFLEVNQECSRGCWSPQGCSLLPSLFLTAEEWRVSSSDLRIASLLFAHDTQQFYQLL